MIQTIDEVIDANPFGEIISAYTRADAIADGVLIDLTDYTPEGEQHTLAKQAGIRYPVAMTAAAFEATISRGGTWTDTGGDWENLKLPATQDITGRMWDVFNLFTVTARQTRGPVLTFAVRVFDGSRVRVAHLKAVCGPGDNLEPVITIMMHDED